MRAKDGLFSLEGRVAVVTGGGRGLGRVLARGLAEAGTKVAVCDIDGRAAARVAADLNGFGGRVDVSRPRQVEAFAAQVIGAYERLDIWVNNAAIDAPEPVLEVSLANWRRVIEVDLGGAFFAARAAARHMARHGGGSIVNVTSIAASAAIPRLASYGASKAGLAQVTRVLALELAGAGIRVNAVAPGYLENVMSGAASEHADPAAQARIAAFTPLGRRARLEEMVGPVVFLASDASSYVTGTTLAVDGGYTAI